MVWDTLEIVAETKAPTCCFPTGVEDQIICHQIGTAELIIEIDVCSRSIVKDVVSDGGLA